MPGFVGIAFRARPDASRYELFYLRPGNSTSEDQAMRNHSVQYTSEPDNGWYKLRRQWPWVYEAWADVKTETWTKVKIEVNGRSARLFVNGSENMAKETCPAILRKPGSGDSSTTNLIGWPDCHSRIYRTALTD